jgi:Tfp pilus assembly protein FimV
MAASTEPISAIDAVLSAEAINQARREMPRVEHVTRAHVARPERQYVVATGDSWWSIASRMSPTSAPHDVLRALHALQMLNPHVTEVAAGARLRLPSVPEESDI